ACRSARLAGAAGRHGRCRGLELPRRLPAQLRRRSLAEGDGICIELCRGARTGAGRRDGIEPERGVRAAVFSQASAAGSDARAGYDGRVVEGDLAMASLAQKRMEDAKDHPIDQTTEVEARPEELRLL